MISIRQMVVWAMVIHRRSDEMLVHVKLVHRFRCHRRQKSKKKKSRKNPNNRVVKVYRAHCDPVRAIIRMAVRWCGIHIMAADHQCTISSNRIIRCICIIKIMARMHRHHYQCMLKHCHLHVFIRSVIAVMQTAFHTVHLFRICIWYQCTHHRCKCQSCCRNSTPRCSIHGI